MHKHLCTECHEDTWHAGEFNAMCLECHGDELPLCKDCQTPFTPYCKTEVRCDHCLDKHLADQFELYNVDEHAEEAQRAREINS